MAELWMPGAIRIESPRRNPLNGNGFRLITWHTFEARYSLTVENALKILIRNGSEAFVFHPITGQWGQCQPMDTGARTLEAPGGIATNRFGSVHQQVEVIGYARQPWTGDLTPAGKAGLARGLEFFRSWGVPDQWAFDTPPPAYPGPGVKRAYPSRSGHAYHAGWIGNKHGDPGATAAPWEVVADPGLLAEQRLYNRALAGRPGYTPIPEDGMPGPRTTTAKEIFVATLESIAKQIAEIRESQTTGIERDRAAKDGARAAALAALVEAIGVKVAEGDEAILSAVKALQAATAEPEEVSA